MEVGQLLGTGSDSKERETTLGFLGPSLSPIARTETLDEERCRMTEMMDGKTLPQG